jgi:hypothetical protein
MKAIPANMQIIIAAAIVCASVGLVIYAIVHDHVLKSSRV